jgi:hypothetical protein
VARVSGTAPAVRALDLVLVMDTTGSMGDELQYLTVELGDILTSISKDAPGLSIRTGLEFYRDTTDEYLVRLYPFTQSSSAVQATLAGQRATGGGDYEEAMHRALTEALDYEWREDAVKIILLIGDAPPHDQDVGAAWYAAMTARDRQIHIVPVAASGVADKAEYLMRAMAALTQSRYLFLTDDSGIGLPHDEPLVDCYVVTHLNGLIQRVVTGLVEGRRVEAPAAQFIRRVGDYDRGVCLQPPRAYRASRPAGPRRLDKTGS